MSKHRLEDAEVEVAPIPRKKSKKEKKEKKDKKDRAEKLNGDEVTALEEQVVETSAVDGTPAVDGDSEPKAKKDKKKKKDKKRKEKGTEVSTETVEGIDPASETKDETETNGQDATADKSEVLLEAVDSDRKSKKEKKEKKDKKDKKKKRKAEDVDVADLTSNSHEPEVVNGKSDKSTASDAPGAYEQIAALSSMSQADVEAFLSKHEIVVTDPLSTKPLRPIMEFAHLPTSVLVSKNPFASFKAPTPIQAASWPFGLSGRDIVGVAETGSGKTIAFGLPLISAVLGMPKPKGSAGRIRAVVVSPTRELAMQTNEQLAKLGDLVGLKTVCVYGGASKDDQRVLLRKADVIVATPGRLKDFLEEGSIKLDGAQFVVLDEADRMLDKGFEDDIKRILGCTPRKGDRQTLMFTATWPQSVQALASTFMVSPVKIQIGGNESGDLQANTRIEQRVEVIDPWGKETRVLELLKAQPKNERVLVFCLYKKEATRVEGYLQQRGIKVVGIHGDLRQEQRTRSLEAFKTGQTPVLVATDVAARGLDIPEVKLVINVTFPLTIEDYVHRIGRTGRAGKTGHAITLFTEHDKAHSGELINILKAAGQPVPDDLMKFGTTVKKKAHGTYGAFFKDVDMTKKGTKITFDD